LGSKNRSRAIRPLYGFLIARFWAPAKIIGGKNGLPLFLLIRRPKPRKQPERYTTFRFGKYSQIDFTYLPICGNKSPKLLHIPALGEKLFVFIHKECILKK